MDSVNSTDMSETILNATKIEIPSGCEQDIELVKGQTEVHLEGGGAPHLTEMQYINIQRVSDLTSKLTNDSISPELLSHHVVDLGSTAEYSQHVVTNAQFYDNSEYLNTPFTEEDGRLTAALVAVKFNLNTSDLLGGKTVLPSVSSLSTEKATVMTSIVPSYVQTIETGRGQSETIIHHASIEEPQPIDKNAEEQNDQIIKLYQPLLQEPKLQVLPPLKKLNQSLPSRGNKYITTDGGATTTEAIIINSSDLTSLQAAHQLPDNITDIVKSECDPSSEIHISVAETGDEPMVAGEYDSDGDHETRSSQKSLPHKKRIPSKLKKALTSTPSRNIHSKCYKCTKCGETFPTQATFNSHKFTHSSKKTNYACEICNKTCQNQLKFFEHLKSHYEPIATSAAVAAVVAGNSEKQTVVQVNSIDDAHFEQTDQEMSIEKVENIPVNDNPDHGLYTAAESHPVFTCNKCGRVFRRQKAFDCHMSISHPKQEEIEEFSEPEDMMEGIRHVVNMVPAVDDEERAFEPWQAPKMETRVIQPITEHESKPPTENSTKASTSSTSKTSSAIASANEVKTDMDDFEEDRNVKAKKQLQCPHCERTFVHRNSLLYHVRSHTGHRPHQCELCGKSFFAAGALKIHMRLHSGDKPYKCEYCGRFFRQWGDLKYHITSIHSNTKLFQCEYCGKDFARKYSLVVHRRIHTGEKNYICEYCTKTFRAASYLQNHRRIHTGEKPHMCEVCGKPFRVRSDMKRHMKTHGDVNVVQVLTELSNNPSAENSSSEVREMCIVNSQEITIEKQEESSNTALSDQEVDQNTKPVVGDGVSPLNLNVRPQSTTDGLYNYSREDLDRESTGTLYVWIQTNPDSILPDS